MTNSTIAAIATPAGSGGIGIIKISGPDALLIAASVFQKQDESGNEENSQSSVFNSPESHRFYYGHIADTENNRVLDEVLLAVMIAPRSYTREDVVEIHAHSGPVVLKSVLELVLRKGAKLAEPGEFTKRAYINGRIDLTQAEAVIDIINAKTDRALEIATSQVRGNMKMQIESIRDSLLRILTEAEAAIDFPDDIEETVNTDMLTDILQKQVADKLISLISQYENAHFIRDGLKVVIAGRPNVGKSSLMNCLLQKDRAIVTPVPGTTRDLIEESFNIQGINVIISDTAGLHETDDIVETIGIKKTHDCIKDSDLVLFTVDMSQSLTGEDYKIYETVHHRELILVTNKQDIVIKGFKFDVPESWGQIRAVETSAINNKGIDALKNLIAEVCLDKCFESESAIIPNLRHKNALEQSLQSALAAVEGIRAGIPFELISIDIRESMDLLGEIIGITVREDVLDQIFSRFCIGK
ncbi:MAG: tRNA uridine-5-carboxymethylaminomethyl(34) synthesis GTPase MnmE [Desulfobacteraceae bacterium]|nr:tRNA uridine-5-carboxymethylaminomethyl(34) synthesis GTPase MnmE [Desulfobacteraceae bacterium]